MRQVTAVCTENYQLSHIATTSENIQWKRKRSASWNRGSIRDIKGTFDACLFRRLGKTRRYYYDYISHPTSDYKNSVGGRALLSPVHPGYGDIAVLLILITLLRSEKYFRSKKIYLTGKCVELYTKFVLQNPKRCILRECEYSVCTKVPILKP